MPWWAIVLIVLGSIIVVAFALLLIFGNKIRQRQANAEKQMRENKQYVDVLIIDKGKKKITEAGLPSSVLAQVPAYSKLMKMPVVKVKVQNRMMTLLAEPELFKILPVKKMCNVGISGLYITELRSVRGAATPKVPEKKKGVMQKLREKAMKSQQ